MGSVSIAVPFTDRWYFAELLAGTRARIEGAGHTVRLHVVPPAPGSTAVAAAAIEQDFDEPDTIGAIAAGFKYQADQSTRVLAWQRPVVMVGGSVLGFPSVMIDDLGAARLAVEHLPQLGHTRIVHIAGPLHHQMDFSIDGRRAKGYTVVMESAGLQPWLVEHDFDPEQIRRSALELLARPDRPTAVFAVSDEVAFPVLEAADELGIRVGGGLSVVGIDDHPASEAAGLTTVRQRPAEIGETAADLLLSGLAHGPDPKQSRLHAVSLVHRASTARLDERPTARPEDRPAARLDDRPSAPLVEQRPEPVDQGWHPRPVSAPPTPARKHFWNR